MNLLAPNSSALSPNMMTIDKPMLFEAINHYTGKVYDISITVPINNQILFDPTKVSAIHKAVNAHIQDVANKIFANKQFKYAKKITTDIFTNEYFDITALVQDVSIHTMHVTKTSDELMYNSLDTLKNILLGNNASPKLGLKKAPIQLDSGVKSTSIKPDISTKLPSLLSKYPKTKNMLSISPDELIKAKMKMNKITLSSRDKTVDTHATLLDQIKNAKLRKKDRISPANIHLSSNIDYSSMTFTEKQQYFEAQIQKQKKIPDLHKAKKALPSIKTSIAPELGINPSKIETSTCNLGPLKVVKIASSIHQLVSPPPTFETPIKAISKDIPNQFAASNIQPIDQAPVSKTPVKVVSGNIPDQTASTINHLINTDKLSKSISYITRPPQSIPLQGPLVIENTPTKVYIDVDAYKKLGTEIIPETSPYPLPGKYKKYKHMQINYPLHSNAHKTPYFAIKPALRADFKPRLVMIDGEVRALMLTDEQYNSQPKRQIIPNMADLLILD